jgi:hypothetical protein
MRKNGAPRDVDFVMLLDGDEIGVQNIDRHVLVEGCSEQRLLSTIREQVIPKHFLRINSRTRAKSNSDFQIILGRTEEDRRFVAECKMLAPGASKIPHHGVRPKQERFGRNAEARVHIERPPAHLLVSITSRILSSSAYRRYVEPHIADVYHEYYVALRAGDLRAAKKVVFWGYIRALSPLIAAIARTVIALFKIAGG